MVARVLAHNSRITVCLIGILVVESFEGETQTSSTEVCWHSEIHLTVSTDGEVVGEILVLEFLLSRWLGTRDIHLVDVWVESLKLYLQANVCQLITCKSFNLELDGVVVKFLKNDVASWILFVYCHFLSYIVTCLVIYLYGERIVTDRNISVKSNCILLGYVIYSITIAIKRYYVRISSAAIEEAGTISVECRGLVGFIRSFQRIGLP